MSANHKNQYRLVQGDFNPSQTRTMLLALIQSKIEFHNLDQLSNEERLGNDPLKSQRRVGELKGLLKEIQELCASAEEKQLRLRINGMVEIELISQRRTSV